MYRFPLFLALAFALTLTACDSDPIEPNDEELITEVTITLTPTTGGAPLTIVASDPDGDGAGITFSPSRLPIPEGTYTGAIRLRDTINNVDITGEVEEEAEEHLFRYTVTPSNAGAVTITDTESDYADGDGNGGDFAVGLAFSLQVGAARAGEDGTLNATLFHFGDEDAPPKSSSTATSDEIDIDIDFPIAFGSVTTTAR